MQFDTRQIMNNEAYLVHQRKRRRFFSRKMPAVSLPPSRIGLNVQFLISSWTDPSPNPSFFFTVLELPFSKTVPCSQFFPSFIKINQRFALLRYFLFSPMDTSSQISFFPVAFSLLNRFFVHDLSQWISIDPHNLLTFLPT